MIKHFLWIFLLLYVIPLYGQNSQSVNYHSITKLSFDEIRKKYDLESDKKIYALAYIKKSKSTFDTLKLAEGYDLMANVDRNQALIYNDSIVRLADKLADSEYAAKGYIRKARILGSNSKFSEAMKALVIANKYANITDNIKQQLQIKNMVGLLKIQLGEYSEGIKVFKEIDGYYNRVENQDQYVPFEHINAIFGMAYGYNCLKEYNSARKANQKAIHLTIKHKDSSFYEDLLVSSAMTSYYIKEYKSSLDSIEKYKKIRNPKRNRFAADIISKLFLGHIAYDRSKLNTAEKYYQRVDSLVFEKAYFHPEIRNTYEKLIKIQEENGDLEKQLLYMNKLLQLDSILGKSYKNVLATLNKEYTTPQLLEEKQKIITSFKSRYQKTTYIAIFFVILFLVSLTYWLFNHKKKQIYKARFELLMKEKGGVIQNTSIPKPEKNSFDLPDRIEAELLKKLEDFEKKEHYLDSDISINKLSKKLETNSRYLSIVINKTKSKSSQNYINELRINHAIKRLKSDEKLRSYTILAIANECGFNTAQAFALSFKKITGINPSYFLKSLESKNN